LGAVPFILSATLACFYSGRGKTMVVLAANAVTCSTAVVFDYLFIFGWRVIPAAGMKGTPGFPVAGVRGAAWATVAASCVGVLFYVCYMAFGRDGRLYQLHRYWRFDRELFGRLIKYGMPAGLQLFLDVCCFSVFMMVMGRLGADALKATNVAFNIESLAFVPMLGMAAGTSALVGRRIGEGAPELATRTVLKAHALTVAYMSAWGCVFLLAPQLVLAPYAFNVRDQEEFADFAAVQDMVVVLLRFVAVYTIFDGTALIYGAAIRGAGDTRFPLAFNLFNGSLLLVLPTVLIYQLGFSTGRMNAQAALYWSFCAVCGFVIVLAGGMTTRFLFGAWKKMRVIEKAPHDDDVVESAVEPSVAAAAQ
jgi:MATE family multidrug resistance protein